MDEIAAAPTRAKCLASAYFIASDTGAVCGQIWLLSAAEELVELYGTEEPLPSEFLTHNLERAARAYYQERLRTWLRVA